MKLLFLCLCVAFAQGGLAPLYLAKERAVPNSFIIRLKDVSMVDQVADELTNYFTKMQTPIVKMSKIRLVMPALTLSIPPHLVNYVRSLDAVEYVEQDSLGELSGSQFNPTWGLDRIDQRNLPLDDRFHFKSNVQGNGVDIYVVDTGIQLNHNEFGGRAKYLYQEVGDKNGHGTHCAGTAAGGFHGIARQATVYGVKICNAWGSCPISDFVGGCDAVINNGGTKKGVVSMSLRYSASPTIDDSVQKLLDSGYTVSVAAGNQNTDSCQYSPQNLVDTITVGAINQKDERAYFSNFGKCVDIFAPGVDITSAGLSDSSTTELSTLSGTSMACPHVTGAAALYFGEHPGSTHQQVKAALLAAATPDVVTDPNGTPNLLLYIDPN